MESLKKLFFRVPLLFLIVVISGCFNASLSVSGENLPPTPMVEIPAGSFLMGSTPSQREAGYRLDEELHKNSVARENNWFAGEKRSTPSIPAYIIDLYPVTNKLYRAFVKETGATAPFVDEETWRGYGLIHPYKKVRRFLWKDGEFPEGREEHPVVLVTHKEAADFCRWRGGIEGRKLRLPTEREWEKAARGIDGRLFPWGNTFDPNRLNSYDSGPFDTVPVGGYPAGKSPYGLYDMAGQVFEWTSTPVAAGAPNGRFIVKGGSWDDLPGFTRPGARHGRPRGLRHILIGFRCAGEPPQGAR